MHACAILEKHKSIYFTKIVFKKNEFLLDKPVNWAEIREISSICSLQGATVAD